ncbi:acyl-CoA dehydrogenase family protein [Candidatus Protofrankia datiscae]|uniref:Long-chain-acyl-CoA dehydrogenase n=1 Tax=Candidatus Protofrankia datiscae TaxID=2716812 RepID=F8B0L9_9ACTN|nr:acyl-CoA dehydrogenase family protein [Candidatus Protofrankia datiscae]AEH10651.1 Long-chain-acyl-CoA dehydrogenase [Candidatus Protofrankia datiscae]
MTGTFAPVREHDAELAAFTEMVRTFVAREITPHHAQWESDGIVPRELWRKAGAAGLLGLGLPAEYGGGGASYRFNAVVDAELYHAGATGPGFTVHNDVCGPYFAELATPEQLGRWVPGMTSGELVAAIAMTEPGAGSDLRGVRTRATRTPGGWLLNGAKTFISNGIHADLVIVVAQTGSDGDAGLSLLVVERGMAGFARGRNLGKVGLHAQDTAELSFDNVAVPDANVLGQPGRGLRYLMANLAQERLTIAVQAVAAMEGVLADTLDYVRTRTAFGQPIGRFQHSAFLLAELATTVKAARVFVDWGVEEHLAESLGADTAAVIKLHTTEAQQRVVDRCLQLHGGYGYTTEYRVGRAWADARVQTIYGGTSEMMKVIISRGLGLHKT